MINKTFMHSRRAFTLIELLCVLAIIFLLLAMLMPALNKVKRLSTRLVCSSNMKGYSTVAFVYLNDNDGVFPNEWIYSKASDSRDHPMGCRWHDSDMALDGDIMNSHKEYWGQVSPYTYDFVISRCPDFRDIAKNRGCENPNHNDNLDINPAFNYTMNGYLGSTNEGGVLKSSEVRAARVFLLAEENSWSVRPDHPKYPAEWLTSPLSTKALDDMTLMITPTPNAKDCFGTYHGAREKDYNTGYGNIAFLDGHVDSIIAEDQQRKIMHGYNGRKRGRYKLSRYEEEPSWPGPAGNLHYAWPNEDDPPGGWGGQ